MTSLIKRQCGVTEFQALLAACIIIIKLSLYVESDLPVPATTVNEQSTGQIIVVGSMLKYS